MKKGLIVFAREPVPGQVKTRLAAEIGEQPAAALYETMLHDVLATARQLDDTEMVVYWACTEESLPRLAEEYRCTSRRQNAGDLGERMRGAFTEMFTGGCKACCIIGSDAPDLPLSYIQDAYQLLVSQQTEVVLGPSRDGGYYLLGMQQMWPQLFTKISWSSPEVLEQSLAAAHTAGATVALLPEWQDIDTFQDLLSFQERKRRAETRKTG